ncbi:hypothetical protein [Natronoarchaeum rubrum]|uniref:hypothetical protein n=1 Tax=Natronoarchaeum rubrum TaxID=755311 RepID=UPI002111A388|nr:hypothetical protein [Natronoarchaeum rubrum]
MIRDPRDRRFVAALCVAVAASVPFGVAAARILDVAHWAYAAAAIQLAAAPACWWLAFVRFENPDGTPIELGQGGQFVLRIGTMVVVLTTAYVLAPDRLPQWALAAAPAAAVGAQLWYFERASWIEVPE